MCHRKGHLDSNIEIRQMMAEQKFFEAQKLIEVQLKLSSVARQDLLILLHECFQQQNKKLPNELLVEIAENASLMGNFSHALKLIEDVKGEKFFPKVMKVKTQIASESGQIQNLYHLLSEYYVHQFEQHVPWIPDWITTYVEKYFPQDFNLLLKKLSILLMTDDFLSAENLIKQLILASFERSSKKGVKEKLAAIGTVIKTAVKKAQLEIYQNFCLISSSGLREKMEFKKLVEMTIYFEDFKFQVLLLNLLIELGLDEEASTYAKTVRENKQYSFVYLDKFFPNLKNYFVDKDSRQTHVASYSSLSDIDLELEEALPAKEDFFSESTEVSDDEMQFLHILKYQTFSSEQLCDLAVSFLQSEMPRVALEASQLAINSSHTDTQFLKGSYLKLTCLLKMNDYRGVLDTCLDALGKATSKDDILSFLYGQAEAYLRMHQKKSAKIVLKKIVKIDLNYRSAKERLEKLDEI